MTDFETPSDLMNNRGLIADPEAFAREKGAASWLNLCGEARTGPRSSALIYLYAGLQERGVVRLGAGEHGLRRRAVMQSDELRTWVANWLEQLS